MAIEVRMGKPYTLVDQDGNFATVVVIALGPRAIVITPATAPEEAPRVVPLERPPLEFPR